MECLPLDFGFNVVSPIPAGVPFLAGLDPSALPFLIESTMLK